MSYFRVTKEQVIYITLILIAFLCFQFNILNTASAFQFKTHRDGSEALVLGKILADIKAIPVEKANLAFVRKGDGAPESDVLSAYERVNHSGRIVPLDLTDSNWNHGFANFGPIFLLKKTAIAEIGYGVNELRVGETIQFSNQERRLVTEVKIVDQYIHIVYSGARVNGNEIQNREIEVLDEVLKFQPYSKQFGLQGVILSFIYKWSPDILKSVSGLQGLAALLFSIFAVLVSRELSLLIDRRMGAVFFLCMIGSPWIVSIARNLYWMPALWLFPVYISFACFRYLKANRFEDKSLFVYGLLFAISIGVKSLCGYEYLPTIFLFSLLPFFLDIGSKPDLKIRGCLWRCLSVISVAGVSGFLIAFVLHGALRSDELIRGLIETIRLDAFKYNAIGAVIGAPGFGIKSSYVELGARYIFGWDGAVLFGLAGTWIFPTLLFGSAAIVVNGIIRKSNDASRNAVLWISALLASMSWSILMKDHSIIHTHLNFVLWYLFFIPVAIYLIINFLTSGEIAQIFKRKDEDSDQRGLEFFEKSKENNFTLLRTLLALSVLFGHSFPVVGMGSDPISVYLLQPNEWIGSMAVHGFFFISGFLVVGSFVRRGAVSYVASRALRLYPAIILYSVLMIFVVGPLFSTVSLVEYFAARPWFNFLNAGLWEWSHNIPYVFQGNPIPGSTNGSAWTLPVELRSYILIVIIGFFGILDTRLRSNVFMIGFLLICSFFFSDVPVFGLNQNFQQPLIYFVVGALFWVNRSLIVLKYSMVMFCLVFSVLAIRAGIFSSLQPVFLGYIFLAFVYIFPYINIDRIGDLSYGIYIYAWPVQQLVWKPGQGPYENFVLSLLIVTLLAYVSWRFIEKPALSLRKLITKR
jgi:peptidoglycan/LPS O-acetylase OafA/YrhL